MKFFCICLVTIVTIIFSASAATIADGAIAQNIQKDSRSEGWLSEPWTGDETHFLTARSETEKLLRNGYDSKALAKKYALRAQKHPTSPLLVFRWGLATYYAAQKESDVWEPPYRQALLATLSTVPSPHSREFARMRFLIESRFLGETYLKKIGERLLNYNPNDTAVKISIFRVLSVITNPDDSQIALSYARGLIVANPRNPLAYRKLGGVYYEISIRVNTRANCQAAINAYQSFLKYSKPTDRFYPTAKYLISVLQKTMPK